MKPFYRITGLLALGLLAGASPAPARQTPATAQPVQAAPAAYPVQAPVRGHLADIFFTAGEPVKRGQLLAKIECPDGTPAYMVAPVAGRISTARLHLGEYLAAHTTLAVIETSAAQ